MYGESGKGFLPMWGIDFSTNFWMSRPQLTSRVPDKVSKMVLALLMLKFLGYSG